MAEKGYRLYFVRIKATRTKLIDGLIAFLRKKGEPECKKIHDLDYGGERVIGFKGSWGLRNEVVEKFDMTPQSVDNVEDLERRLRIGEKKWKKICKKRQDDKRQSKLF